jgi:hypothetical protein
MSHRIVVQRESGEAHWANPNRLFDRRCRINRAGSILMTDTWETPALWLIISLQVETRVRGNYPHTFRSGLDH